MASGSSQRVSLADPQPPAGPPAAPPTEALPLSADSVSLKPALPVGVVQAVHRLDHQPQVPEQTLLRNSIAPHTHRPSHMVSALAWRPKPTLMHLLQCESAWVLGGDREGAYSRHAERAPAG